MGDLWHFILGDGYARLAKTTVEEGVELLAYSMWLSACIEYVYIDSASPVGHQAGVDHSSRRVLA